jgi:soluble lytic murein transglycosylase-like protein
MTPGWLVAGTAYLTPLNTAERLYRIPQNLLVRIAFQESSFRPEVIEGDVKSPAGAVGMMQLMPEYFPGAGVSVLRDIDLAAAALASFFNRFHDWQLAVAAYNWGPGNVDELIRQGNLLLSRMPLETQKYIKEVFTDVPIPGVLFTLT